MTREHRPNRLGTGSVMTEFVLEMRGITKRFPGVTALDEVDFTLRPGEVHGLVGENGAGKSTLMKILAGAQPMDAGEILVAGAPARITSPHDARDLGISMIYQEFNLVPRLSVAENIFLGRPPRMGRRISWRRLHGDAREVLDRIGVDLDTHLPVGELSVAQQQMVEIAKALSINARIIVMDEPSATLTGHELETLFELILRLRRSGIGVVYISHRLEELFSIAQRVTVMRDGRHIATNDMCDVTRDALIRMMVGREVSEARPENDRGTGDERLRVEGLGRRGAFHNVSFALKAGEIVGLTGLVGSGRTEVARTVFGADRPDTGEIRVDGEPVRIRSPREAIAHGIGLLTEDRKNQGLVLMMSVRENITASNLAALGPGPFLLPRRERPIAARFVEELHVKTPSIEQLVRNLSGGNQQKVVLAKWLFTQSRVLIFDEPTRGIDVGAKAEIYRIIRDLAAAGTAVLVISSELPEILHLCDRILVMHEGRVTGEISGAGATQEEIMRLATGGETAVMV